MVESLLGGTSAEMETCWLGGWVHSARSDALGIGEDAKEEMYLSCLTLKVMLFWCVI